MIQNQPVKYLVQTCSSNGQLQEWLKMLVSVAVIATVTTYGNIFYVTGPTCPHGLLFTQRHVWKVKPWPGCERTGVCRYLTYCTLTNTHEPDHDALSVLKGGQRRETGGDKHVRLTTTHLWHSFNGLEGNNWRCGVCSGKTRRYIYLYMVIWNLCLTFLCVIIKTVSRSIGLLLVKIVWFQILLKDYYQRLLVDLALLCIVDLSGVCSEWS